MILITHLKLSALKKVNHQFSLSVVWKVILFLNNFFCFLSVEINFFYQLPWKNYRGRIGLKNIQFHYFPDFVKLFPWTCSVHKIASLKISIMHWPLNYWLKNTKLGVTASIIPCTYSICCSLPLSLWRLLTCICQITWRHPLSLLQSLQQKRS